MATRYAAYDSHSSSSKPSRHGTTTRAVAKANPDDLATSGARNGQTIGAMVKRLMKPKIGSTEKMGLAFPHDRIAEDAKKSAAKKGPSFSGMRKKLFQKSGGDGGKVLTEVKTNTRTLGMVLRSERELLGQTKIYEAEVLELKMALEEKNNEVEKLKDLCLKQREEIKTLKNAILFPDVVNAQLQALLNRQGSDLKEAKEVIPDLQRQVSSLTEQLMYLAEELAEVKADKNSSQSFTDGTLCSPKPHTYKGEVDDSLDFDSSQDMFLRDFNPCLTPCSSKKMSKKYDEMLGDNFSEDESFGENWQINSHGYVSSHPQCKKVVKSSEHCNQSALSFKAPRKMCKSAGINIDMYKTSR